MTESLDRTCDETGVLVQFFRRQKNSLCISHLVPEVNISSYPATDVAGSFFSRRAEILNSGGFVQKYSDQGVSCKNIGQ